MTDQTTPPTVYALSVHQPWAWALIEGPKRVENRNRNTNHRGRLIIHASKPRPAFLDAQFIRMQGIKLPLTYPLGALIGELEVVDCVKATDELLRKYAPWAFGEYLWITENPIVYPKPIPWKGALGLFKIPAEVCNVR